MGKWYVVEILEHRADPQKLGLQTTYSYIVDSCPIVKLKPLEYGLKLLWSEEAGNLEYIFRIQDISKRSGVWQSIATQNGISLCSLLKYLKFFM